MTKWNFIDWTPDKANDTTTVGSLSPNWVLAWQIKNCLYYINEFR